VRNGAGLGINIAGGKGSTPFKENDEVALLNFLSFERENVFQNTHSCFL
jgi:hypothetical protein